ncbi:MAG: T9SS type A sorting domain-containing protein [Bacteroidota bacterium]
MRFIFIILSISFFLNPTLLKAQSAPITIDGMYDDWSSDLATFTDPVESVSGIDLLEMQVTNDENFLFIRIITDTEINLTSDLISQRLMLYIDADNDPNTGFQIQDGYGSELGIDFRDRTVHYNVSPYSQVGFSDIQMRPAPTITSNEFEIAIGRDVVPNGINPLFPSNTIRILFKELNAGDNMPNTGEVFYYTFDDTPVMPLTLTDLDKEQPNYIRIVAYNTLVNGLKDPYRVDNFENIIKVLNPDIIGFSECGNTNTVYVKSLLDNWIPLGTSGGWYINADDTGDLITASRWQMQTWQSLYRQLPTLINLPASYQTDLLFTNAHLRCCGANYERQQQVDSYVAFMLDAHTSGGEISLPADTPFVYAGDLNLVGYAQQLETLITGDIQNTAAFGQGAPYDWDNTDVTDQICRQSDKRMAYTWRHDSSSYAPGRLDFMIYSDAVMVAEKSFTLQTEIMSTARLQSYGLNQYDTRDASDHFPVVTDFSINAAISTSEIEYASTKVYPNPTKGKITIQFDETETSKIQIYDSFGVLVFSEDYFSDRIDISLDFLSSGIYFMSITGVLGNKEWYKVIKK